MSIAATIREKLMIALRPTRLDVINESHVHAGHQSSPGTGESHFRVLVMSPEFGRKDGELLPPGVASRYCVGYDFRGERRLLWRTLGEGDSPGPGVPFDSVRRC